MSMGNGHQVSDADCDQGPWGAVVPCQRSAHSALDPLTQSTASPAALPLGVRKLSGFGFPVQGLSRWYEVSRKEDLSFLSLVEVELKAHEPL